MSDRVTILRPIGRRLLMAKAFSIAPDGLVTKTSYPDAKRFRVEQAPVGSIHDLHRLLCRIEPDAAACVIRGEPIEGTDVSDTRRVKVENGGNFADVPRRWIMLDLDHVQLPVGMSVIADPQEVADFFLDLAASHVPELEGVTAVVQFSASAGLDEQAEAEKAAGLPPRWHDVVKPGAGVGAHIWYWLDQAADWAELARWAAAINARADGRVIDPNALRTIQVHYTAGAVFGEGLRDPLAGRRTLLIEGDAEAAVLAIPAVAPRPAYVPGESRGDGRGFQGWLDKIGGPDGFHQPIMQAVASFIATNWPKPDTAALKAALAERIGAADPGSRSKSAIARYASEAALDARIAWAMAREKDKRGASGVSTAAPPIAPTYPADRAVPLPVARCQAGEAFDRMGKRTRAGQVPQLLLRKDVGGGKTFAAIEALPMLLDAGRAVGRGPALFTHPRHALGDQIAANIRETHPHLKVAVWRGMDAADPASPSQKMCGDPELPRAAAAAGQPSTAGCPACPLAPGCAYLQQAREGRDADVWVAPHQTLFTKPFAGWPRVTLEDGNKVPVQPSVVIIDEDMTGAALVGLNPLEPIQLALSSLASDETPNVFGPERELLLFRRRRALEALTGHEAGGVFRDRLEPAFTPAAAREWGKLEWDTKPKVRINKGTSRDAALAAFADAADQRFTRLRPMLAERIAAFLDRGDARSVELTFAPEAELGRGQGTGPAVRFAWRQDIHDAWAGPLLFLDATGRAEILRHWAPDLIVADIEIMAPYQHVVQVSDQEFGRRWLMQPDPTRRDPARRDDAPRRIRTLVDVLMVEVARADGAVLAIAQLAVERLLRAELARRGAERDPLADGRDEDASSTWRFPSGAVLHLAHHGAVTGSNEWQDVATVVSIGRPATNRPAGERWAEVLAGKAVGLVSDAANTWWPMTTAALRMKDGTGRPVDLQPRHPDPLVEAMRWSVTEGAVLQGVGRPRGVRRTAANPVRVVILAALALPLTVAENPTWDEYRPDRLTTAAAEAALFGRALPLAPQDLSAAREDLWATPKAAERYLGERRDSKTPKPLMSDSYKGFGGFRTLALARYRKGAARRWSEALVPALGARTALEALVGPLVAFALDDPAPTPAERPGVPPGAPVPATLRRPPASGPGCRRKTARPPLSGLSVPFPLRREMWRTFRGHAPEPPATGASP